MLAEKALVSQIAQHFRLTVTRRAILCKANARSDLSNRRILIRMNTSFISGGWLSPRPSAGIASHFAGNGRGYQQSFFPSTAPTALVFTGTGGYSMGPPYILYLHACLPLDLY
ncbi:hypothetical protein EVAR_59795_1 [Eumeta japonica]|uniref:Uncharacterized protein n=1 Tax=Eumeta variegata TaxID=151549 RepID=A0A4C1YB89_EUMVA|nr:hypothetical protein EVAR_59795_1 [Eumeta japonica]